jgi:uncharacterized protein YjbI with pentapeptide repeats
MHDTKREKRQGQDKSALNQTTTYTLQSSHAKETPEAEIQQDTDPHSREKNLIERYKKGQRDFPKINLEGANLQGVGLSHIRLIMANLHQANLRQANLRGAKLRGADLREADLREADLRGANLQDADLEGVKLAGAKLDNLTQVDPTWRLIWETINDGSGGHQLHGKLPR